MDESWKTKAKWVLAPLGIMWVTEIAHIIMRQGIKDDILISFGLLPRSISGFLCIPLAPFIHVDILHVFSNTLPFAILGGLVIAQGTMVFLRVSCVILLLEGMGVWLMASNDYHVGASGIVFGYFGFLIANALYARRLVPLLIAALTIFLYGGIIWGVLPSVPGVSWEAHFFGLLAGIAAAKIENPKDEGNLAPIPKRY